MYGLIIIQWIKAIFIDLISSGHFAHISTLCFNLIPDVSSAQLKLITNIPELSTKTAKNFSEMPNL